MLSTNHLQTDFDFLSKSDFSRLFGKARTDLPAVWRSGISPLQDEESDFN